MSERLTTKRQCYQCGRYGTRGFRRLGGWWVCSAVKACYLRRQNRGGYCERFAGEDMARAVANQGKVNTLNTGFWILLPVVCLVLLWMALLIKRTR